MAKEHSRAMWAELCLASLFFSPVALSHRMSQDKSDDPEPLLWLVYSGCFPVRAFQSSYRDSDFIFSFFSPYSLVEVLVNNNNSSSKLLNNAGQPIKARNSAGYLGAVLFLFVPKLLSYLHLDRQGTLGIAR